MFWKRKNTGVSNNLIQNNNSVSNPTIKILTASEADKITSIKEPEITEKHRIYQDFLFMEVMRGINEAAECGCRCLSMYYYYKDGNGEYLKKRLFELGYSFVKGTHDNEEIPDLFVIW